MAYQSGKLFRLMVETTPAGTFIPVKGMNTADTDGTTNISRTPVFDSATPVATVGDLEETLSVAGLFDPVDPGQVAVRTAARAQTAKNFQVLHDGINGYERSFIVTGKTYGANADGSPQAQSFSLVPNGDPTIEGTGPLP